MECFTGEIIQLSWLHSLNKNELAFGLGGIQVRNSLLSEEVVNGGSSWTLSFRLTHYGLVVLGVTPESDTSSSPDVATH